MSSNPISESMSKFDQAFDREFMARMPNPNTGLWDIKSFKDAITAAAQTIAQEAVREFAEKLRRGLDDEYSVKKEQGPYKLYGHQTEWSAESALEGYLSGLLVARGFMEYEKSVALAQPTPQEGV